MNGSAELSSTQKIEKKMTGLLTFGTWTIDFSSGTIEYSSIFICTSFVFLK